MSTGRQKLSLLVVPLLLLWVSSCEGEVDSGVSLVRGTNANSADVFCSNRVVHREGRIAHLLGEVSEIVHPADVPPAKANTIFLAYDNSKGHDYKLTPAETAFDAAHPNKNYGLYAARLNRFMYTEEQIRDLSEAQLAAIVPKMQYATDQLVYIDMVGIPAALMPEDVESMGTFLDKDNKPMIWLADTRVIIVLEQPSFTSIEAGLKDDLESAVTNPLKAKFVAGVQWNLADYTGSSSALVAQQAMRSFHLRPDPNAALTTTSPALSILSGLTLYVLSAVINSRTATAGNGSLGLMAPESRYLGPPAVAKINFNDILNGGTSGKSVDMKYTGFFPTHFPLGLMAQDDGIKKIAALAGGKATKSLYSATTQERFTDLKSQIAALSSRLKGYNIQGMMTMGDVIDAAAKGDLKSLYGATTALMDASRDVPTDSFLQLLEDTGYGPQSPLAWLLISGANVSADGALTALSTAGGYFYGRIDTSRAVTNAEDSVSRWTKNEKWYTGLYPKELLPEMIQIEGVVFRAPTTSSTSLSLASTFPKDHDLYLVGEARPNVFNQKGMKSLEKYLNSYGFVKKMRVDSGDDVPEENQKFATTVFLSECVNKSKTALLETDE